MRANLLQLITRNWPIKGAALFLALMLYVAVQLQQPVTTSFDVDLNVQLPPGRALVHKPPKVRVQISGKGSQILKLRSLAGDITIALDSVSRKDVRIVSLVTVTPESGQMLHGGLSISPTTARLVGPEKSLAGIESVTTVQTEITNVSGAFTRNVPIDTMPLGIVRLAPKQVTVTGEMGLIAERSFAGIPVETGAGAITSFIVTPARVAVNVRGPEERVQALTRDSLRVVAHITGSSGGIARITVVAPRGITARAFPDSVTLRRRGTPRRG